MNLLTESASFWTWFASIVHAFFRNRPWTTLGVISASVAGMITRILSFLLPLKVILLAGSSGVPRYFPFIDPADKMGWIIGLSLLAVASYGLTIILENLVSRMSSDAGGEIMQEAIQMAVLKKQEEAAQEYFADFCGICANLLFLSLVFLVLLVLNPWLLFFILMLFLGQYMFTFRALSGSDVNPGRLKSYILDKLPNYLKILSSINFLLAFLVILTPFLIGSGNILVGIISIVLIRRSLGFIVGTVKTSVDLFSERHKVDALVFPEIQLQKVETREALALRDLFQRSKRQKKTRKELKRVMPLNGAVDVLWADSPVRGVSTLNITVPNSSNPGRKYFQQQIFMPNSRLLENEDFLFRHISREQLMAPRLITRFRQAAFECQICEFGKPVSAQDWRELHPRLIEHYWSWQPPENLVELYSASRMLLHQRLNAELAGRTQVAVDTNEEADTLKRFQEQLPQIQSLLESLPLYIFNPECMKTNTVYADNGQIHVMTWGRWSLEPVGSIKYKLLEKKRLAEITENIKNKRYDIPDQFSPELMSFAAGCLELEAVINKGSYKAALQVMDRLLKA